MESIKIGTQSYELVADGYQLQQDGGEFRLPDLREKYAALEEEVTNTQLAIVELYEGGEA